MCSTRYSQHKTRRNTANPVNHLEISLWEAPSSNTRTVPFHARTRNSMWIARSLCKFWKGIIILVADEVWLNSRFTLLDHLVSSSGWYGCSEWRVSGPKSPLFLFYDVNFKHMPPRGFENGGQWLPKKRNSRSQKMAQQGTAFLNTWGWRFISPSIQPLSSTLPMRRLSAAWTRYNCSKLNSKLLNQSQEEYIVLIFPIKISAKASAIARGMFRDRDRVLYAALRIFEWRLYTIHNFKLPESWIHWSRSYFTKKKYKNGD